MMMASLISKEFQRPALGALGIGKPDLNARKEHLAIQILFRTLNFYLRYIANY